MPTLNTYNSEKTFQEAVVSSIHSRILKCKSERKVFRMALSGGTTPKPIYNALSQKDDIDWSQIEIYLVDERCVPLDDEKSNYRMIREQLVDRIGSQLKSFVFFDTSFRNEDALEQVVSRMISKDKTFFDLVLLGIGADGHTASLFPNSSELKINKSWVAHTQTDENDIKERLTLTYPALESSKEIFFLVKGPEKRGILEKIQSSDPMNLKLPAARLFHTNKTILFYCEQ